MSDFQLLITGGPGSGATTTGKAVSEAVGALWCDSDSFFHKPTDPPFQEQYSKEERSTLLHDSLSSSSSWILSGSISAWGITDVVGFCFVSLTRCEVVVLALLPEHEAHGNGKKLLAHALNTLKNHGCSKAWLGASHDATSRSYGFYRHLGWSPTGENDSRGGQVLELVL